jgi:hypothetical protein
MGWDGMSTYSLSEGNGNGDLVGERARSAHGDSGSGSLRLESLYMLANIRFMQNFICFICLWFDERCVMSGHMVIYA